MLPVFIYAMIAFVYFLQIIGIQEKLQKAITETGLYTAKYAYVYDYIMEYEKDEHGNGKEEEQEEGIKDSFKESIEAVIARSIDSTYYKAKMQDYLDVNIINHSCIENGYEGIHAYLSAFMEEGDAVDIILVYNIKLPLLFVNLDDIPVMQRVRLRGWSGHKVAAKNSSPESPEENEDIVYITETGTVYHLTKECTHLALSVSEVNYEQIDTLRNDSGGRYKKCSLCGNSGAAGQKTIFITNTGDRYHWNLNCSGLKRTIIAIPISEAGDRSLCTRCGSK